MKRRICYEVISEMLPHIPTKKKDFLKDLNWNFEDSLYKAPEETIHWRRTMQTLQKHIPDPQFDWEFKVLSLFTTKSEEQLKKEAEEYNLNKT